MKGQRIQPSWWRICLSLVAFALSYRAAADVTVFSTQFEAAQGYSTNSDLIGQNGWVGEGSGGNGLLSNFMPGQGQQAYIGFSPPNPGQDYLTVWKPIDYTPLTTGNPVVTFSVTMGVADSGNTNYDNFRWSVYNSQGNRLFSIDFDNYYLDVNYQLDGTNELFLTGTPFNNSSFYNLSVTMNFASNRWTAVLDKAVIASNQPITTTGAPLNLGDVDAVWLVFNTNRPGNNYLLFDNYKVTAAPSLPGRPLLQLLSKVGNQTSLRLLGESGWRFAIDATTNFTQWTPLKTNIVSDGSFDYADTAASAARRFYRARFVP